MRICHCEGFEPIMVTPGAAPGFNLPDVLKVTQGEGLKPYVNMDASVPPQH